MVEFPFSAENGNAVFVCRRVPKSFLRVLAVFFDEEGYITRRKLVFALLLVAILPTTAFASSIEASGTVTNVVDGDTFDIRIEDTDPRIIYEIERVRLADVDSPEMSTPEGPLAKEFAAAILLNKLVWLDIDDRSEDGRGPYDRLVCIVYLADSNGLPIPSPPFNRILVDSGYAEVKDYTTNEFDSNEWWSSPIVAEEVTSTTTATPTVASSTSKMFVGSTQSDKYHYPSCRWAKKILPQNEIWFSSSAEAKAAGYVPCGVCKPP